MKQTIKLRTERDFSGTISTTFDFIRYNFKMIMTLLIRIPGPLILFSLIMFIPYYMNIFDISKSGSLDFNMFSMGLFGIGMLLFVIAQVLSIASVNEFMKLYLDIEDADTITVKGVYFNVKEKFWEYLGAYLLVMVIVIVATMLFIIPGIYIGIALIFVFSVISFEKEGVIESINRSYKLISGNWWATFGLMIVIAILASFINYIFVLPISGLSALLLLEPDMNSGMAGFLYAVMNSFTFIVVFFTSVIYYVAINIKYFSIVEQKEQVGLKEQIEQMNAAEVTEE